MKICFECSEYPPGPHGGIGSLVQILARGLVKAGHRVRVVGLYDAAYPAPDYEQDNGVAVWRLRFPAGRWGWVTARRRLFSLVRTWCLSGDVELIEVPDYGAPAAGWPSLPVPVVVRLSGSTSFFRGEMGRRSGWSTYLLERASIRRGDFLCSESSYLAAKTRALFGIRPEPDAVIYNPVDLPERLQGGTGRDPNSVLFAGTLTEKKGVVSLVRAWPEVIGGWPGASLHIWGKDGQAAGGGSMRDFLASLLPPAIAGTVRFHGHVPLEELLAAFQRAGMAVLPSYAEGFALTPLHAMAAGCPTIYTSRGSGPELIDNGTTGLLVDPDLPEEIARAILALLRDTDLARRLGESGRRQVEERFSWPVLLAQNEGFYNRCLQEFGRRRHQRRREKIHAE
jgi:glycosyltransferase involved in cell wall biosynthesis